jgi:hypothetical protein
MPGSVLVGHQFQPGERAFVPAAVADRDENPTAAIGRVDHLEARTGHTHRQAFDHVERPAQRFGRIEELSRWSRFVPFRTSARN